MGRPVWTPTTHSWRRGLESSPAPSKPRPRPEAADQGRRVVLELMLPAFVACLVLVGVHAYLGLHVIAREVIFVDLSIAQMAALWGVTALLVGAGRDSTTAH